MSDVIGEYAEEILTALESFEKNFHFDKAIELRAMLSSRAPKLALMLKEANEIGCTEHSFSFSCKELDFEPCRYCQWRSKWEKELGEK